LVTLKDIAKRAGVNISTVSRALNHRSDIAEETREMIESIAKELNYKPNLTAQALMGKSTKLIGVLVPEIESNYFVKIINYLEEFLRVQGYSMIMTISNFNYNLELEALELFENRNVDGILVACSLYDDITKRIDYLKGKHIPVVLIEALTHLPDYDYVMIDDTHGMTLAVKHLMEQGHTRIGFISDNMNADIRYSMYLKAMSNNGLKADSKYVYKKPERFEEGGYLAAKEMLACEDRPTAVITGYDSIAIGVMKAVWEAGYRIPEDFAIIGNDNIREAAYLSKGLTTVSPPVQEMAKMAVNLLIEKIENPENKVIHNIKLKPEIIIRETT
jgi:DNA-binding LacI/PurR family transcriptional regulator